VPRGHSFDGTAKERDREHGIGIFPEVERDGRVALRNGPSKLLKPTPGGGKTYTRTPVFRSEMRYIDLNPIWTVPPGIVREVLADIRRDPTYLRRLNMRVLDRSGRPVHVSAASLGRYFAASFPYVFRQSRGR
jgi:hypothetical protein